MVYPESSPSSLVHGTKVRIATSFGLFAARRGPAARITDSSGQGECAPSSFSPGVTTHDVEWPPDFPGDDTRPSAKCEQAPGGTSLSAKAGRPCLRGSPLATTRSIK